MRFSGGTPALRSIIAVWRSTAQRTVSGALRNSMIELSPVRSTTRPWCTEMMESIRSLPSVGSRASVRLRQPQ
jgi:hypothetical protein